MYGLQQVTATITYHVTSILEMSDTKVESVVYDNVLKGLRYKGYNIDVVDIDTCIVDGVEYNKYVVVVAIRY